MQTHRESILQAVAATIAARCEVPVHRSRREALDRRELPAVVVMPGGEQNERLANRLMKRVFQVLVEVHARADSTPGRERVADQVADPVIAAIHQVLFADPTLGGRVATLIDKEMQEPEFADGDETAVHITLVYEAVYATSEGDITHLTNH